MTKNKITVFIIDDDPYILESLRMLLEGFGYLVECFSSSKQFLKEFSRTLDSFLITDVRMPEMDGIELLETMAQQKISIPTIIMTGYGDVTLAVRAMQSGAVDFIEKPFTTDAMMDSIERVISSTASTKNQVMLVGKVEENLKKLTRREREIFDNVVNGSSNKQIANKLGISARTVENHRAKVMEKMEARGLSVLVRMALSVENHT